MDFRIGSDGNPNFIQVQHGLLVINVPRSIFKRDTAVFREPQASDFMQTLVRRYPWLTPGAIEVIRTEAQETMRAIIELEEGSIRRAKRLLEERRPTAALGVLDEYLSRYKEDVDAWELKGKALFMLGESEEAFRCFARARKAMKTSGQPSRRLSRAR
ncbi:MAG: hypothetical protein NT137_00325 [Methanomassiliicoccales archaeon]|nr:hypothetical protein [Methanomassiliicoccales archaeon]